jgi:O-antigen ligase
MNRAGTVIVMEEARPLLRSHSQPTVQVTLLFALLSFSALAFGGVEPWAIYTLEVGAAILCAIQIWQLFRRPDATRWHPLYPALFGMTALVLLQVIFATTVYAWITLSQLKGLIALEMLFFVAVQILHEASGVRRFFYLLSVAGFLIAAFAIVQKFTGNGKIYWLKELHYNFAYFGPYVNKNHYAGLMEMLFPLPLFLAFQVRDIEKRALLGFLPLVMAASIFLSNSRGGMLACMVQIVTIIALSSMANGGRKQRGWIVAVVLLTSLALLVWWMNDRQAIDRLLTLRDPMADDTSGNRLTILKDSLPMIRDYRWFGTGLGTFPTIYPSYRSFYSESIVNAGHNDYLQLIVETGICGAVALGYFLWMYVRNFLRLGREWQFNPLATLQLAAAIGCLGLLVHSVVDFNLHIPANAALFFVLLAVAGHAPRRKDTDAGSGKLRSM